MDITRIFCEVDHPTEVDLKNLGFLVKDFKPEPETPEKAENPGQENKRPSKEYWTDWIKSQYQKKPFGLNSTLASDVTEYFTEHSSVEFVLHPNHLLENLAGYYADQSESKDEYLYYKGIQESVRDFNELCVTLMDNYPSNPDGFINLQKTLDENLAVMKIDADFVPPADVSVPEDIDDDMDLF